MWHRRGCDEPLDRDGFGGKKTGMNAALRAHGRDTTTRLALLAAALGACLLGAGEARAASWLPAPGPDLLLPAATPEDFPTFVSGEVVVRFADAASAARRASALRAADATVERALPLPGVRVLALPAGASVADAVADLRAQPGVLWAEPNYVYHADATPNDPLYGSLYGLNQASDADIDAPEAWDLTTGSPSVTVGVVDTGVALDHPDLAANLVAGQDFVDAGDADPMDEQGHGTHVAGTIAAVGNNGVGVTGVSWGSKIMPLRALDANGSGTSADIAEAFAYAGSHGVPIVNASLGGTSNSFAISSAIASSPNTLFVVAAGNDGVDNDLLPHYPCALAHVNVLCVAATDASDGTPSFSNWGAVAVDVGAPGNAILSTSAFRPVSGNFPDGFDTPLTGRWTTTGAWAISGGQLTDSPAGDYSGPAEHDGDVFDVQPRRPQRLRAQVPRALADLLRRRPVHRRGLPRRRDLDRHQLRRSTTGRRPTSRAGGCSASRSRSRWSRPRSRCASASA